MFENSHPSFSSQYSFLWPFCLTRASNPWSSIKFRNHGTDDMDYHSKQTDPSGGKNRTYYKRHYKLCSQIIFRLVQRRLEWSPYLSNLRLFITVHLIMEDTQRLHLTDTSMGREGEDGQRKDGSTWWGRIATTWAWQLTPLQEIQVTETVGGNPLKSCCCGPWPRQGTKSKVHFHEQS